MAVYTQVSAEALEAFLAAYDVGEAVSFKGIAEGVENSNFFLHAGAGRFILTLYEKRVEARDVPFFLALMRHLADAGFPCPAPVADRSGKVQAVLEGRPAALLQFLDGVSVHRPAALHCRQVGGILARLHVQSAGFGMKRANRLGLAAWRGLLATCEARLDAWPHDMRAELRAGLDALEQGWPQGLPQGIVHADLFPDNVLFRSGRLAGVIDFYFACQDALAYDIAVCINAWCFAADGAFAPASARALLDGYGAERRLSAREFEALPVLCRGAAMRFLLTRLHDWLYPVDGSLVSPKDPGEYLAKLRFHAGVTDARNYGLQP